MRKSLKRATFLFFILKKDMSKKYLSYIVIHIYYGSIKRTITVLKIHRKENVL